MTDLAVATTALTKRYGHDVLAVDRVELRIAPGEIYAFLGLNGAGKSTTIRMLLGMIRPTEGSATLFGRPVRADDPALWRRVGHLVESATAYPDLTVRENLEAARRLQGVAERGAVDREIRRLNLGEYAERRARALSLGNLQRLALARALLHEPELLVLDEPANGLDPAGLIEIRELLTALAHEQGVTIFLSSHLLSEVDRFATRIGIVHRGRLVEELDSEALQRHRDPRLEVGARDLGRAAAALRAAGFAADPTDGATVIQLRDPRALSDPDEIARILVAADTAPTHLAVARETLEDHFMRLTGGQEAA